MRSHVTVSGDAACTAAENFRAWNGSTRSSWSALIISSAGYFTPFFTCCSGEYAERIFRSSGTAGSPYSEIHVLPEP